MSERADGVPFATAAMSLVPGTNANKRACEYESRFGESVKLWKHGVDSDRIWVPRELFPRGPDMRSDGIAIKAISRIQPRSEEQARVIQDSHALLRQDVSHVIAARTGSGKTVMALDIVCRLRRSTLVVIPKTDLIDQWRDRILEHTTIKPDEIGLIQQGVCDVEGKKIVLGMLHSLAIDDGRYPDWIFDAFGLTVFDEVHRVAASTLSVVAGLFNSKLRLGLSATPYRIDGKDKTIQAHIGEVRVRTEAGTMTPVVGLYSSPWKPPTTDGYTPIFYEAGKTMHVEKSIAHDKARNDLLMRLIMTGYKKGRRTVIFSSLVLHLQNLLDRAIEAGADPKDTALYISSTVGGGSRAKEKERERAKACRLIFSTYGMMGEGTDIPWLDCCILATPRAHVKQAAGRILREFPDKPAPAILDIVDDDGGIFRGYSYSRKAYYKELGAKVIQY